MNPGVQLDAFARDTIRLAGVRCVVAMRQAAQHAEVGDTHAVAYWRRLAAMDSENAFNAARALAAEDPAADGVPDDVQ